MASPVPADCRRDPFQAQCQCYGPEGIEWWWTPAQVAAFLAQLARWCR